MLPTAGDKWDHDLNPEFGGAPGLTKTPISLGTKVMILNLDPDITEDELKELFQGVGAVRTAVITTNMAGTQTNGEVVYRRHEDALKAIEEFHGREVNGRQIRVLMLSSGGGGGSRASTGGAAGSPTAAGVKGRGATGFAKLYSDRPSEVAPVQFAPLTVVKASSPLARAGIRVPRGGARGGRGGGGIRIPSASGPPLVKTAADLDAELDAYVQ